MSCYRHNSGFTLVELSIVLVIIGMIVGGILVGRDLIHATEIRKAIRQPEQFDAAFNAFKTKYNCLPGDCATAYQLGLTSIDTHGNQSTINGPGSALNGNGDGMIFNNASNWNETTNAFWWLRQAGLINDPGVPWIGGGLQYTDYSSVLAPIGVTRSAAGVSTSHAWNVVYASSSLMQDPTNTYFLHAGHYYRLSAQAEGAGLVAEVITPADAFAIDAKIDDGLPRSGKVLASGDDVFDQDNKSGLTLYPVFDLTGGLGEGPETGPAGAKPSPSSCITSAVSNTPPFSYNVQNTRGDNGHDNGTNVGALCSLTVEANF